MPDIDLDYRPRSYWPAGDPPDERVVLAQISVDSVLGDLNTVTAEPTEEGRIRFSLLSDEGTPIATLEPETADAPLSLGELITLIDTADIGDLGPGFVGGLLEMNSLLGTGNPQDANFVSVGSELYPGLAEHYDRQILAWVMGEVSGAP